MTVRCSRKCSRLAWQGAAGGRRRSRSPIPIDLAIESLRDIDLLVLVGVPEPVAFFAYPGKPTRLVREGCVVLTLAGRADDLVGALEALAGELDATKAITPRRRRPFLTLRRRRAN